MTAPLQTVSHRLFDPVTVGDPRLLQRPQPLPHRQPVPGVVPDVREHKVRLCRREGRRVREGVVLFEDVDESCFASPGSKERKAEFKLLRKSYPAVFAAAPGCIRVVER